MPNPQTSTGGTTQTGAPGIEEYFRGGGGVGVLLSHAKDFGLSDAQVEQLEALKPQFELARHDLQAALAKAETQLRTLLQSDAAAESDVMAAIDAVARAQADQLKMRYRNLQKARGLLNDAQRGKVRAFRRQQEQDKAAQRRQ